MFRHATLVAVALALVAAPLPAAAATPAPAPAPLHDEFRPHSMKEAGDRIAAPAGPTATPATTPAPPRVSPAATSLVREVFGFAQAGIFTDPGVGYTTFDFSLLSTVAYFGLHVNAADGSLRRDDLGWQQWNSAALTDLIARAHAAGTRVVVTVIYQDYGPGMCAALSHYPTTVSQIVAQMSSRQVDGINVDYEGVNSPCNGQDNRSYLRQFVQALRGAMGPAHLTVDTYASSAGDPGGYYDIAGMAGQVDGYFVMAYELDGNSQGGNWRYPPLSCGSFCMSPTSPLSAYYYNDSRVADEYIRAAGAGKTILGLPYYGYTACVDGARPNAAPVAPAHWSVPTYAISQAETGDGSLGSVAHRDPYDGVSRWDTWYNSSFACTREMYWDDADSLGAKYDLVNRRGLLGAGMWSLDYGGGDRRLWDQVALHFTRLPSAPASVTACAGDGRVSVGWSPAISSGGPVTGYTITAQPGGAIYTTGGGQTALTIPLANGGGYSFTVRASNPAGLGPASAPSNSVVPSSGNEADVSYLAWYDSASVGMNLDAVHLLAPGPGASGCIVLPGVAVASFAVPAGGERVYQLAAGSIGGPVRITATAPVMASQRVTYFGTFNEAFAQRPDRAGQELYFAWYDTASVGMNQDNIHLVNPSATPASVTVSLPGATPLQVTVPAGEERHASFPRGTIGGPVRVSSDVAVLATQRVTYNQSFNEVTAVPAGDAATTAYFSWFDHRSVGMNADFIHIVNLGPETASGTITVGGAASRTFSVGPGAEGVVGFEGGVIGGPVTVRSSVPVLASQRVTYFDSFNEVAGRRQAQAATALYFNWFDSLSYGMYRDDVHVLNPGAGEIRGTVTMPGQSPLSFVLPPNQETFVSFPGAVMGGPVVVRADAPVLASQRVTYNRSFNEVSGRSS